jgi:hypothetical protein
VQQKPKMLLKVISDYFPRGTFLRCHDMSCSLTCLLGLQSTTRPTWLRARRRVHGAAVAEAEAAQAAEEVVSMRASSRCEGPSRPRLVWFHTNNTLLCS